MGLSDLKIVFDDTNDIFYSGQSVSGTLCFKLTEEKRIRGVELTFQGEANVHWSERKSPRVVHQYTIHNTVHNSVQNTRYVHYSNSEKYLNQTVYLVGSPDADFTLAAGEYSYPFHYYLPNNVPSSFEGDHGYVRYIIKGKINRPWRFNHRCKRAFTVICPLDLNSIPKLQEPVKYSVEKVLYCGVCKSDPLTLVVSIPLQGFVPGQEIKAVIEADDQTGKGATIKSALIQKVTFTASCGRRKQVEKEIGQETLGVVFKRGSLTETSSLKIPSLPPSHLANCNCININYVYQVRGVVSKVHLDAKVEVPLTIGSIPLVTQFDNMTSYSAYSPSAPMLPRYPIAASSFMQYPQMPPPSYEECVFGKTNIRSEDDDNYVEGNLEFAPRYPIFHFK